MNHNINILGTLSASVPYKYSILLPMPVVENLGVGLIIAQSVLVAWAVDVYILHPIVNADSHVCENVKRRSENEL